MKRDAMTKVQKAIAKLYFALGEAGTQTPTNAEITEAAAEYMAYLAIRNTGGALGLRYFAMGASSARRKAVKPPRGKKKLQSEPGKALPPKGKKPEKQIKSVKFLPESKKHAALLAKAKERTMAGEDFDLDNCFESGWEE
jgi:hypothetical protein